MLLGEYIREYRTSHGDMSQDAFAKISGISKGYISMLERNQNPKTKQPIKPTIDICQKVAKATGLTLNELFSIVDSNIDLHDSLYSLHYSLADEFRISPDEQHLIEWYRQLNPEGQACIKNQFKLVLGNPRFHRNKASSTSVSLAARNGETIKAPHQVSEETLAKQAALINETMDDGNDQL